MSLPSTFDELSLKVFDILPKSQRVDFVTDTYKDSSIKDDERRRRGSSEVLLLKGSATRLPRDWKSFLSNSTNKSNLIKLLLKEWKRDKYAAKLVGWQVYFVCEDQCVMLTSTNGITTESTVIPELCSSQAEADTRIVLHMKHVCAVNSISTDVVIRSPDTDVFLLLLHHCSDVGNKIYFDTGVGNKRRVLAIKSLIDLHSSQICKALLGLHAFTGTDTTSAFVRKGKLKPFNLLLKNPTYLSTFQELGNTVDVNDPPWLNLRVANG